MQRHDSFNYGRPGEPGDEPNLSGNLRGTTGTDPVRSSGSGISPQDERTWSSLAHLSILINLVSGFGGLIAAPLIWLFYRERAPKVAFHALQSFWYQAAWAVLFTVVGFTSLVLLVFTLGLAAILLVPFWAVFALIPFAHGIYAAYRVKKGRDYRYPFIADLIDGSR